MSPILNTAGRKKYQTQDLPYKRSVRQFPTSKSTSTANSYPYRVAHLRDALDHHQAQPPNVRGPPVCLPVQPLGGHISHRSYHSLHHRARVVQLPSDAEVGQFYLRDTKQIIIMYDNNKEGGMLVGLELGRCSEGGCCDSTVHENAVPRNTVMRGASESMARRRPR